MEYSADLEIHFHEQDRVSVLIESNGGNDEKVGELTLFAVYACRQMVNFGRGPIADSLASLLIQSNGQLQALTGRRNAEGARLVDYAGSPGRKRFEAQLRLTGHECNFTMLAKDFGPLNQGVGYYAPTSVMMLIQHLVERRLLDEEFLSALGAVAAACGSAFLAEELTIATQREVALSAVAMASGTLTRQIELESDEQRSEAAGSTAFRPDIVSLIKRNGEGITRSAWLDILGTGDTSIAFASLSMSVRTAFHSIVVDQAGVFAKHFPEAVPTTAEELLQDIGGYVMNGYVIGRHLLGTPQEDLSPLTSEGVPEFVAAQLLGECGGIPPVALLDRAGQGFNTLVDGYLDYYSKQGVYARIAARDKAPTHLYVALLNGFALAVAEHIYVQPGE